MALCEGVYSSGMSSFPRNDHAAWRCSKYRLQKGCLPHHRQPLRARQHLVTSNKSFESWAEVFPDAVIASAVLDRLVHHAHLVPIVGESFRMKDHKTRHKGDTTAKKSA